MRNYKYLLLVSTCLLFNNNSHASELDLTFNHNHISLGINALDTHTPVELKPILNFKSGVKIAAVCALGSGGCNDIGFGSVDDNINLDNNAQCKDEGFVNSCSKGSCIDKSCPYTKSYGKCISENCPTNASSACSGSTVGKNTCGDDCNQCCVNSCPSGYTYTNIPNGYVQDGEPCMHCTSGVKYKIKANPCTGYSTCNYGPASGANSCLSGSVTKYDDCRPCDESCPYGTSTSNPGGCGGSTRNECRTKTCYYAYESCWTHYDDHDNCAGGAYYCSSTCSSCGACTGCGYDSCYNATGVTCNSNETCSSTSSCGKCQSCRALTCTQDGYDDCGSGYSCQGNSCKINNPCDGVVGLPCNGYNESCATTGSCGECTSCKVNNPCAGVTGVSCNGYYEYCKRTGSCGECTSCGDYCSEGYELPNGYACDAPMNFCERCTVPPTAPYCPRPCFWDSAMGECSFRDDRGNLGSCMY